MYIYIYVVEESRKKHVKRHELATAKLLSVLNVDGNEHRCNASLASFTYYLGENLNFDLFFCIIINNSAHYKH